MCGCNDAQLSSVCVFQHLFTCKSSSTRSSGSMQAALRVSMRTDAAYVDMHYWHFTIKNVIGLQSVLDNLAMDSTVDVKNVAAHVCVVVWVDGIGDQESQYTLPHCYNPVCKREGRSSYCSHLLGLCFKIV